jgi:iron complex transport system ATP-binding protein
MTADRASRSSDAPLQAHGLSFVVKGKAIVDGVTLSVRRGELLGVIGPNGAGKTTLLRLLSGLLAPTAGVVTLAGMSLNGMSPRRRARLVTFMGQELPPPFAFTVMEVLLMGRYPHRGRFERDSAEDREKARRMLSYVGLPGFEDRKLNELSGGEGQLVLFARSLVQDTEIILLDEPSSSLDIRHQDRIFSMAQELARENRALVASVHNLDVAAQYCSRLLLLEKGKAAAEGRPREVLTTDSIDRVYGVRTLVSSNPVTGSVAVTVIPSRAAGGGARIHLIGGAGSAVNLTRELYRLGYTLSGGIAHEHDSDEKLWRSLGVPCAAVGAFSRISEQDVRTAARSVQEADLVILCSFPVGTGNVGNLMLAGLARRLAILATGEGDMQRSFFAPESRELFDDLCRRAQIMGYEELLASLPLTLGTAGDRT